MIGGGAAGLAAAWELSRPGPWRRLFGRRYEVTVYQQGWRLGGKGASGRDPDGRIEEHGLHIWFGFYRNAFDLIERCWAELGERGMANRLERGRRDGAFTACARLGLVSPRTGAGSWETTSVPLPARAQLRDAGPLEWIPLFALRLLWPIIRRELAAIAAHEQSEQPYAELDEALQAAARLALGHPVRVPVDGAWEHELDAYEAALREAAAEAEGRTETRPRATRGIESELLAAADGLIALETKLTAGSVADTPEARLPAHALRFAIAIIALTATFAAPRLRSRRFWLRGDRRPFDELNALDLREALGGRLLSPATPAATAERRRAIARLDRARRYLCGPETLDAAIVRVLYDLAFAYEDGDRSRPNVAAGVGVENVINILLLHRGNTMQMMRAGMGDIVFAPLYRALSERRRGRARGVVRFEFFSAVERIDVDERGVRELNVRRQARLDAGLGPGDYEPLLPHRPPGREPIDVWPNRPRREQLDDETQRRIDEKLLAGSERGDHPELAFERVSNPLRFGAEQLQSLRRAEDFDEVVLAIPPAAIEALERDHDGGADLLSGVPALRRMVERAHPVATQALQLWFDRPPTTARVPGSPDANTVIGGYCKRFGSNLAPPPGTPEMFDTYCDMSHLLGEESGSGEGQPQHLAYFCRVTSLCAGERDPATAAADNGLAADRRARAEGLGFLREHAALEEADRPFLKGALGAESLSAPRPARRHPDDRAEGGENWEERFRAQYWRCNSGFSERYSTSRAGTVNQRLHPGGLRSRRAGDSRVRNLTLAGDWTYTAVNAGSVEAAVSSGIAAARAVVGPLGRRPLLPWWRRAAWRWLLRR